MVAVKAADGRDPRAARYVSGARREDLLHVADRGGVFERRVIPGPVPHQHHVIVVVDDARHDGAAFQVDPAARGRCRRRVAHRGDPAGADRHARGDAVRAVHGVDPPVDQHEIVVSSRGS
jgi:hypothetical protein